MHEQESNQTTRTYKETEGITITYGVTNTYMNSKECPARPKEAGLVGSTYMSRVVESRSHQLAPLTATVTTFIVDTAVLPDLQKTEEA